MRYCNYALSCIMALSRQLLIYNGCCNYIHCIIYCYYIYSQLSIIWFL